MFAGAYTVGIEFLMCPQGRSRMCSSTKVSTWLLHIWKAYKVHTARTEAKVRFAEEADKGGVKEAAVGRDKRDEKNTEEGM
uniref:Uncharacterized protein n=1 Tax=Vespula pensylvanica TaxID=30213 RepID=A0A834KCP9_VESPE|nr:hypothetical protein H0235_015002 [Vespula pensylvanica]